MCCHLKRSGRNMNRLAFCLQSVRVLLCRVGWSSTTFRDNLAVQCSNVKGSLECLTLAHGTYRLCRNVAKQIGLYTIYWFLGAFVKLRKATISYVMSVRMAHTGRIVMKFGI